MQDNIQYDLFAACLPGSISIGEDQSEQRRRNHTHTPESSGEAAQNVRTVAGGQELRQERRRNGKVSSDAKPHGNAADA